MRIRTLCDEDVPATVALWHETRGDTYHFLVMEAGLTLEDSDWYFRETIRPSTDRWLLEQRDLILEFLAMKGRGPRKLGTD